MAAVVVAVVVVFSVVKVVFGVSVEIAVVVATVADWAWRAMAVRLRWAKDVLARVGAGLEVV